MNKLVGAGLCAIVIIRIRGKDQSFKNKGKHPYSSWVIILVILELGIFSCVMGFHAANYNMEESTEHCKFQSEIDEANESLTEAEGRGSVNLVERRKANPSLQ